MTSFRTLRHKELRALEGERADRRGDCGKAALYRSTAYASKVVCARRRTRTPISGSRLV